MTLPPETLADQAPEHLLRVPGSRKLIALAGPPAAGKSTIAALLCDRLLATGRSAAVVPMDGFHLDNALLESRGLLQRKGAAETFDADGFCHLVGRIARGDADIVYPVFDRHRDIAIAGAAHVKADVEFVRDCCIDEHAPAMLTTSIARKEHAMRRDPFKGHRFPREIILQAVRWYCRFPLSYQDVCDLLAERGITVDRATVFRWVQKFGPEIAKRIQPQELARAELACG